MLFSSKSKYRPEIDGLRAVAILGVLIFHSSPQWLSGGYVGVDVFFVISGYLISSVIQRDLHQDKFSFAEFYERRIRRIFPAMFVMIMVVMIAGSFLLFPEPLVDLSKSIRKVLVGLANLHFLRASNGYFAADTADMPLLHMWSLAVEEQFYLLFPLLVWILHCKVKEEKLQNLLLGILFAGSLGTSIWLVSAHPSSAFYTLQSRAWEILLGVLVFRIERFLPDLGSSWNRILGMAGFGLISGSMFIFTEITPFPGGAALVPCVGAALVIISGRSRHSVANFLRLPPVVFIGKISYSVYLWHWPFVAFLHVHFPFAPWMPYVVISASLLTGWISWRWVEAPFRVSSFMSRRSVYFTWILLTLALILCVRWVRKAEGFPQRFDPKVLSYLSYKGVSNPAYREEEVAVVDAPVYGNQAAVPTVAVWGDSHAESLMPLFVEMADSAGVAIKYYGRRGMPPIPGVAPMDDPGFKKKHTYPQEAMEAILKEPGIKTVIWHCRWAGYYKGQNEDPVSIRTFNMKSLSERKILEAQYLHKLHKVISELAKARKTIVIVYPIPEVGFRVPPFLARKQHWGEPVPESIPFFDYEERDHAVVKFFDDLPENNQIIKIRPAEKLLENGRLKVRLGGAPLYSDDDHISSTGALFLRDLFSTVFPN